MRTIADVGGRPPLQPLSSLFELQKVRLTQPPSTS